MGDPDHVEDPVDRLLSADYARQQAQAVRTAVDTRQPIALEFDAFDQTDTVNISSVDAAGNLVALTLTHGGAFGARVSVPGLGLTLGHGISRFDPSPGFPNSLAPGKRPLNNMCPSIVVRGGRPMIAIGGSGGRRIPSALCGTLLAYAGDGRSLQAAIDGPRLHAEGDRRLDLDDRWEADAESYLVALGYEASHANIANLSAVAVDRESGSFSACFR